MEFVVTCAMFKRSGALFTVWAGFIFRAGIAS